MLKIINPLALVVVLSTLAFGASCSQNNSDDNYKKGVAFLASNAKAEGVKTTTSGLQYKVLKAGSGTTHPKATDRVKVHYHGTLIDGTVFDSSVNRGEPISF